MKRGALARFFRALGVAVLFAAALVLGAVLHLGHPAARRVAIEQTEAALARLFAGRVVIDRVDRLDARGLSGGAAHMVAPDGTTVLRVFGVRARANVVGIVRSALFGDGPVEVPIDDLFVDYADVSLDAGADGGSRLRAAFARPAPAAPSDPRAREVLLHMPKIVVRSAWVHGQVPGTPPSDLDVAHVEAALALTGAALRVDMTRYRVRTRGAPSGLDAEGGGTASLTAPSPSGAVVAIEGTFDGTVGGIGAALRAALDGARVDVSLDVPRAPADRVHALFPDAPALAEVGVRVEAHGELPRLETDTRITLGGGTLRAVGPVVVTGDRRATLSWDASGVDLRAMSAAAPPSSLAGRGTVDAHVGADASVAATFTADVAAGTVGATAVPPATLAGTFTHDAAGTRGRASGRVHEVGAPTDVTIELKPDGAEWELDVTAHATIARLGAVARLTPDPSARGAADVRARGKLWTRNATVDATADAELRGVELGDQRLARGRLTARVTGKIAAPAVSATLDGKGLELGGLRYATAAVTARGTARDLRVTAALTGEGAPDVKGTADVTLGAQTVARDVRLTLSRDKLEVAVTVPRVSFGRGDIRVEEVQIRGFGAAARATLDVKKTSTLLRAHGRRVSLARLAQLFHVEATSIEGSVDFDVNVELTPSGAQGTAQASLTEATVRGRAATAELAATADGRRWSASLRGRLEGVGDVELAIRDLELGPEGPLRAAAWREALGTLGLRATVDLAGLAALAPPGRLPFAPAGTLDVSGAVSRGGPARSIAVSLAGSTRALSITTPGGTRVAGVEAQLGGSYDGAIGATGGVLVLSDAVGTVARLDVQSDAVPYRELWASRGAPSELVQIPLVAKLVVPKRPVDKLPAGLAIEGAHGEVQGTATLDGTLALPRLFVTAQSRDFASKGTSKEGWLSADVTGTYDGKVAHANGVVRAQSGVIAQAGVDLRANVKDLITPTSAALPWDASAQLELSDFPLSRVALLADHEVRGKVSGVVVVEGLHRGARAMANLTAKSLQVGNAVFPSANLALTVDDSELRARAHIEQSAAPVPGTGSALATAGFGEVAGSIGVSWGRALLPTIDPSRPMEATLATKRLRATAFLPFVDAWFGELDGLVDANAIVSLMPGADAPTIVGSATLEGGVVQVAAMGTQLHGARGHLSIGTDGTVRLTGVVAHGVTGTVKGSALAKLEGLHLASASADLEIPKGQAVPMDIKGVQIGDVWGEAHATAVTSRDRATTTVTVDIPKMHAQLPLQARGAKDREELENVQVGVYSPGRFTTLSLDGEDLMTPGAPRHPHTTVVTVNFGADVEVRRGRTLSATLEGSPRVTVTDRPRVDGTIRLTGGAMQVQGKRFEIEKGTVSFTGDDASNPLVVVSAGWTAADGTRVYADFAGPLRTGAVTLRSVPSRPKDEIVALILFGSADQSGAPFGGNAQADASTRAGGAAGTFATEGLSEGLDELTGLQIATKVDTSNAANPRPEVEVQLARTISLQVAFVLGAPPPGANPDKTFATIGWRFARRWLLETTFGDHGSSFADVVWQLRY